MSVDLLMHNPIAVLYEKGIDNQFLLCDRLLNYKLILFNKGEGIDPAHASLTNLEKFQQIISSRNILS